MKLSREGERTRRRSGRRRHSTARIGVLFIWVILILTQLSSSSAKHANSGPSGRKAHFFKTVSFHAGSSASPLTGTDSEGSGELYGDDKRIVHTGPNPLHN